MELHRIAPDAGMNVRCICGAEYSLATNASRHVEAANAEIFERFADRAEYAGFGYVNARRHLTKDTVARADRLVLEHAIARGLTEDQLFTWANSKEGRWFGSDAALGRFDRSLLPA